MKSGVALVRGWFFIAVDCAGIFLSRRLRQECDFQKKAGEGGCAHDAKGARDDGERGRKARHARHTTPGARGVPASRFFNSQLKFFGAGGAFDVSALRLPFPDSRAQVAITIFTPLT